MSYLRFFLVLLLSYLTTFCAAQDVSATPSLFLPWTDEVASSTLTSEPSKTSAAPARTFTVQVGNGDHKFKPEVTNAGVGDIIEFWFYPQNHSVVRAEFEFPCIPYELTGKDKQGFWSGFFPVEEFLTDPPKFRITVNDTKPIFFYCSAPGSCKDQGMVGAINPPSQSAFNRQKELSTQSSYQLSPGEPVPAESPLPSNLPTDAPIAPHSSKSHKLSTGAIAGIAVGAVSVIVLGCLLFFFWGRSNSLKEEIKRNEKLVQALSPISPNPSTNSGRSGHSGANSTGSPNLAVPASFPHYSRPTPPYGALPTPHVQAAQSQREAQPRLHLQVPGQEPHISQHPAYHPPTVKYISQLPQTGTVQAPPPRPPPPAASAPLEAPARAVRSPTQRNTPVSFISTPISYYHGRTATTGQAQSQAQQQGSLELNEKLSPVDPNKGGVPVGPYGRQMQEWYGMNQSAVPTSADILISATPTRGPAPPYYEFAPSSESQPQSHPTQNQAQAQAQAQTRDQRPAPTRPAIYHVNQQLGPAEIDGSPVVQRGYRF